MFLKEFAIFVLFSRIITNKPVLQSCAVRISGGFGGLHVP